ncbi:MAG: YHS domain-containing protein [Bacteroidetes bacterium]|nr:YHS domain-containing protein [Fibrella sp.]
MKTNLLGITALLFFLTLPAFAQQTGVFAPNQQAIRGYDPVAYFTDNRPVKGLKNLTYAWQGATWSFASQANLNAFRAAPEKYAPQYGGYCAYGLSEGHKAPTDPDAFTIVDEKLYLNYNPKVRTLWSKDRDTRIRTANEKWPKLKDEPGK